MAAQNGSALSPKQVRALRIVEKVGRGSHLMIHHTTFDSLCKRGLVAYEALTEAGRKALEEAR